MTVQDLKILDYSTLFLLYTNYNCLLQNMTLQPQLTFPHRNDITHTRTGLTGYCFHEAATTPNLELQGILDGSIPDSYPTTSEQRPKLMDRTQA